MSQAMNQSVLATISKAALSEVSTEGGTDEKGDQQSLSEFVA